MDGVCSAVPQRTPGQNRWEIQGTHYLPVFSVQSFHEQGVFLKDALCIAVCLLNSGMMVLHCQDALGSVKTACLLLSIFRMSDLCLAWVPWLKAHSTGSDLLTA